MVNVAPSFWPRSIIYWNTPSRNEPHNEANPATMGSNLVVSLKVAEREKDKWYRLWYLVQGESDNNNELVVAILRPVLIIVDYFNDIPVVRITYTHTYRDTDNAHTKAYIFDDCVPCPFAFIFSASPLAGEINIAKDEYTGHRINNLLVGCFWIWNCW